MNLLPGFRHRTNRSLDQIFCLLVAICLSISASELFAQDAGAVYVPAVALLPQSTAGLVRITDVPAFAQAWKQTHIGRLIDDPSMQPFVEAQRARAKNFLESANNKIGFRPDDLRDLATGEAVVAWLPFEKDKRRPFAICIVADVRGRKAKVDKTIEKVDQDLKAGGATRKDVEYRGQTIRVYTTKPKPGQLKIDEIAIAPGDTRLIVADRDTVVTDLLDAIAGEPKGQPLSKLAEYQTVLSRSSEAIDQPDKAGGGTVVAEWYARPFEMGRILRETFEVDRGNQVDVIKLLEGQGFDAVKAAGGVLSIAGTRFDLLHRGFVLAPPTSKGPSRYEKAAGMLQFFDMPLGKIPSWVHEDSASLNRLRWRLSEAFWASESLIDEAFGDEIFRPMIEGIRDDEEGPQIDLEVDVLARFEDQVILLTDNTLPANANSERMLVAIRVQTEQDVELIKKAVRHAIKVKHEREIERAVEKAIASNPAGDVEAIKAGVRKSLAEKHESEILQSIEKAMAVKPADAIKRAIRRAMEVEPDASKMEVLPGIEIWRVQRGEAEDNFDNELFGDLGFDEDEVDAPPPLLDHWAIALVDKGPGSEAPYLMFSSHPDLLVETAKRVQQGAAAEFGQLPEVKVVTQAMQDLGYKQAAFDRIVRMKLSLRAKYALIRQGKLKDSDSVMASLYRRMFEGEEGGQPDPLNAAKLPPLNVIEQHLPEGGGYAETIHDGWSLTGFLLR